MEMEREGGDKVWRAQLIWFEWLYSLVKRVTMIIIIFNCFDSLKSIQTQINGCVCVFVHPVRANYLCIYHKYGLKAYNVFTDASVKTLLFLLLLLDTKQFLHSCWTRLLNLHIIFDYKQNNIFVMCKKMQFYMDFMHAVTAAAAIHPMAGWSSIKFTKYNYAFKHKIPHREFHWPPLIECKQFTKMHSTRNFFCWCCVELFLFVAPLGNFILVKLIHWLCIFIFIFSYSYSQCMNMHSFDLFHR